MSSFSAQSWRPLVGVIIPCYNSGTFVADAVRSALAQTYPFKEVLVVNNGSTDDTGAILRQFEDQARIITRENIGLCSSRNLAMDSTEADLFAFLDADDRWHPTKLEEQVDFLRQHPTCPLVHTAVHYIDSEGKRIAGPLSTIPPAQGMCQHELIRRNTIIASSVLVRRDLLDPERFFPDLLGCEDWDLWIRVGLNHPVGYLDKPLTEYRIHDHNLSKSRRLMFESSLKVMMRTLDLPLAPAARFEAVRQQRLIQRSLAHLEFEAGNFRAARRYFWNVGRDLRFSDVVRWCGCYLPGPLRAGLRRAWRTGRSDALADSPR